MAKKRLIKGVDYHMWGLRTRNGKIRPDFFSTKDRAQYRAVYGDTVIKVKFVEVLDM